jgi:hypothetical protein
VASDGRWYPPELHPSPRVSLPEVPSPPGRSRRKLWIVAGIAATLLAGGIAVGAVSSSAKTSRVSIPATTVPIGELAAQYERDWAQYQSAGAQIDKSASAISADITKQEQRYQTDANTYSSDVLGSGCSISLADPTGYSTCVSQDEQAATNALNDEDAAEAAFAQDRAQLLGLDGPVSTNINTFVQELLGMAWPKSLQADADQLENSMAQFRSDLAQEVNALNENDAVTGDAYSAQVTADESNAENAGLVLSAKLGINPPPASTNA